MVQNEDYTGFNEKKKLKMLLYSLTALTILILLIMWFSLNDKIDKTNEKIEDYRTVFNDKSIVSNEQKSYMLKEYNGKLGVYIDNDFQYDINIYVHTLPENDKKLLSKGIVVSSEQELFEIISTYY